MNEISAHIWDPEDFIHRNGDLFYSKFGNPGVALFEFAAFWIDPFMSEQKRESKLANEVMPELDAFLEPFVKHYPFAAKPLTVLLQSHENEWDEVVHPYLYGSQECPESVDHELLRGLIWEFSGRYPDLYIWIGDQEYQVCQVYDKLPKWMNSTRTFNRVWVNKKRIIAIPPDRPNIGQPGLPLEIAISTLWTKLYSCPQVPILTKFFNDTGGLKCIKNHLERIINVEVVLSAQVAQLLSHFPYLIVESYMAGVGNHRPIESTLSFGKKRKKVSTSESEKIIREWKETNTAVYTIGVPDWIAGLLEDEPSKQMNETIYVGLEVLAREDEFLKNSLKVQPNSSFEFKKYDCLSRHVLEKILIKKKQLSGHTKEIKFVPPPAGGVDLAEEELMRTMGSIFANKQELEEYLTRDQDDYEQDDEDVDEDELDEEVKKSLEGSGISKDDFFEFFLKNALNMNDEEVEVYRTDRTSQPTSKSPPPTPPPTRKRKEYNDDSDYTSDEDEFPVQYNEYNDYGLRDDSDDEFYEGYEDEYVDYSRYVPFYRNYVDDNDNYYKDDYDDDSEDVDALVRSLANLR
ncbi:hypothetical protein CAAN1_03S02960 [[Candida] anglica]|uniref:Uncharacterized protein n=1 Tax=[Candida] anglica TaxID=148631 RepID=A0ABP0ELE1_9ASCO